MADTAVSFLLDNVTQLVTQEISTLLGVGDEIKSLHVELIFINQFLRNSKGKREKVKDLISLIQNLAHKAEDVIDTFVISMAKNKRRNLLGKIIHSFSQAGMLQTVSADTKSIVNQINTIYSKMEEYGIEKSEATGRDDPDLNRRITLNKSRCQVEEDEVVSFVKDADQVMKMLNKTSRRLDVISILGMGGLGKTTLAKKVYNDNSVKKRFDCRAWVNVSQDFDTKELLLNILRRVAESTNGIYNMDEEELAETMRKCLEGKRYLIVLDDVWTTKVWKGIKGAFPDNMNGCRILVTSRVKEVASHASTTPPYLLPLLSKNDGWELLSKKAFRGEDCRKELEEDGRKIVDKCKCLPLALVVVGGLLATREKTTRVWSQIADNVSWYLEQNLENCLDILALSYEELPPHLKLCFLYFGVFPEDFEISARQLIRLWIAEGFITQDNRRKLEDVAEGYLEDLVDRNLIMVGKRRCDGGVKSCFIHDLLRDLCISEGIKENFFVVHTEKVFTSPSTSTTKPRRLSIHCITSRYTSSIPCDSSLVRTLLCFGDPDKLSIENFRSLYKGFRLLRVLDLGSTRVTSVPTQVEKLIHLRYLRMNAPQITEIPSSISNLPNLQTLDLRESRIKYFTSNFWNMQQLRHLYLSGDCSLPLMHRKKDIKTMCNLQTLSTVSSNVAYLLDGDTIFPNLRKLGLRASQSSMYVNSQVWEANFKSVQSLKIVEGSHFLSVKGVMTSWEPSICGTLTKLTLIQTKIKLPILGMLAKLPTLEILKLLKKSVAEVSIECGEGWFPKLQVLHMAELDLKEWTFKQIITTEALKIKEDIRNLEYYECRSWGYLIEQNETISKLKQELLDIELMPTSSVEAMQNLRDISISKCRDLVVIPKELGKMNNLRRVKASWCAAILEAKLRQLGNHVHYEFQNYS